MMISYTIIYEIISLLLLSNIILIHSTKQYYKLDARSKYNNVYKTQQYQQQQQQQQQYQQQQYQQQQSLYYQQYKHKKVDLNQYDDTAYAYYGDNYNYQFSYSYSNHGSQYYSYSSSYYYSIMYMENSYDDDSIDDDSSNDENHYGIIKFFIAGFVTITGIYFYRNYYIDKKIILDKGYEMVNINDGDDSNIDDEINEAAEMHKNVNIKDLKYIPVNTNDE